MTVKNEDEELCEILERGPRDVQLLKDWCEWFFKDDRDKSQEGKQSGIVFLRGQMIDYDKYSDPLVVPLTITEHAEIVCPIIATISLSGRNNKTVNLIEDCKKDNDLSLITYLRLDINGKTIISKNEADRYLVNTDKFELNTGGRTWEDYEKKHYKKRLENTDFNIEEDDLILDAACSGVMCRLKLKQRDKPYILRIKAKGVRDYKAHAIYVITVTS